METKKQTIRVLRKKVYIASPYTIGDVAVNVRTSLNIANNLIELGFAPFAPLLSHFQHMLFPQDYETWLDIDFNWIPSCDFMLRLPGESRGADREVEFAKQLKIPVFNSVVEMLDYIKQERKK